MEKKQSSIEWFYNKIKNKKIGNGQILLDIDTLIEEFEQAKAMHKEEVQDAYRISPNNEIWSNSGIDYYNETFEGGDENSIGEKLYTKDEVLDLLVNMNSWPTTFEGKEDITEWFEQGQYY